MRSSVVLLLSLVVVVVASKGYRKTPKDFLLGRRHGGFVLPPPEEARNLAKSTRSVATKYFVQKLDNFDPSNNVTWKQRYQVNDGLYQPGGPIFVMIGGEGEIDIGWMTYGDWYKNAQTHKALMFQPEHRYYGDSHPTYSCSKDNLKWLSSEQALEDLANFIKGMRVEHNVPAATKVVVFGGSYPGSLSAYFREKYPDVAIGGIASSAPVLAEADFYQYMEDVGQATDYFSPGCSNLIKQAVQQIDAIISAGGSLNGKISVCGNYDLKDPTMRAGFYQELMGAWQGITQYNGQYPSYYPTVKSLCDIMQNAGNGDLPTRMYKVFETVYGSQCIEPDQSGTIAYYQDDSWLEGACSSGGRQWLYQSCTEFGYFQTTNSDAQPFGNAVTVGFIENVYCKGIFGLDVPSSVDNAIAKTNENYGGKLLNKPNSTNIVLINGSIDPWHTLGVTQSISDTVVACFITGTSHCFDMRPASADDSAELKHCRQVISDNIAKWLA